MVSYRDKKVVGVFVHFRAPLRRSNKYTIHTIKVFWAWKSFI
jgi:hypothetical protein